MADFDLTQTDQQVQNILNDGQSAMGAGAQTTLTTEYVMLKDTNGVYHKILKSSFTEAIRDVLAGLLVNNDKGTTISQIAAIASGDFGSVTPANLASVLGEVSGFSWRPGYYDGNINDLNTPGFVYFQANEGDSGLPNLQGGSRWWWVITYGRGDLSQIIWNNADFSLFVRVGGSITSSWKNQGQSAWRKVTLTNI